MKKITLLLVSALFLHGNSTFARNDIFADIKAGNREAIRKRLENCENCAVKDEQGNNALHIAAQEGNDEMIEILTTNPACQGISDWFYSWLYAPVLPYIDDVNNDGDSPLLCTVYKEHEHTAECLLKKGASIEIVNKKGFSAPFVAMIKDNPKFIPIFVAYKLNLDKHRRNGDTVLHAAIKEKKPNFIYYCSQQTSLHNSLNKDNKTPIFVAIDTENEEILNLFKKEQFNGCMHYAVHNNKYKALNYLLSYNKDYINEPDAHGNTPVFYAQDEKMLNFLVEYNADLSKRNKLGENIITVATRKNDSAMMNVLIKEHHMDVNARDNKGQTFLIRAGIEQNYQAMQTLINLGANIRITDNARENVLHKIARKGDRDAAKIILECDKNLLADINKDGNSPLFIAIQNGHMTFAEFLIDAGASVNNINNDENTIIHEIIKKNNSWLLNKVLVKVDKNLINQKNKDGKSPLLLAAANDGIDTVKSLMDYRVNIYTTDREGNSIAHIAIAQGNNKLIQFISLKKDLLNTKNNNGETPFVYGAKHAKLEVITLLLTEDHFIKGDVKHVIGDMEHMYRSYDQQKVYEYLLHLHNNRINECDAIVAIAVVTSNLITHNNNLSKTWSEKTHQSHRPESLYSVYSNNALYVMTQAERNNVKNTYLERQNRELVTKNTFEQRLQTIVAQEQSKEQARVDALRRQTEPEGIATQQGTTVAEQKNELDRIAADKYAADIAKNNQRIAEEQKAQEQKNDITNVVVSESVVAPFCCICYEEGAQLLKKIPCKNIHSDHICGACLAAASINTCPICRGTLTK